jgi:calpain-15
MPVDLHAKIKEEMPFTDYDFPPEERSLLDESSNNSGLSVETAAYYRSLQWQRASDVFKSSKIAENVSPDDIAQGKLGDCYFLSVLSVLATDPNFIKSLFVNPEINKAGIYAINFYINGEKTQIIVDDAIPCDMSLGKSGYPAFASSKTYGDLWVILLEKAWAKLHGGYCKIRSGQAATAFAALTNKPSLEIEHAGVEKEEEVWRKLQHATRF